MRLEEIADVTVGQIMTRVTADNGEGEEVKVLVPKAVVNGVVVRDDLGSAVLVKKIDADKYTKFGDVVLKLSTPYDAAFITDENEGLVLPSFCAVIRMKKGSRMNAKYLTAYLNSEFVRNKLRDKVIGATRPMIKVSDVRTLELPQISERDMKDIGEAFLLSGKKKAILNEMIEMENRIMENVILASIKEGMNNE